MKIITKSAIHRIKFRVNCNKLDLQQEFQLTYIFISHDLSVVRFMSDRIMVMNKGKLAEEINSAHAIITQPQSPYTQKLINSIPQFPDDMQWLNEQN